MKEIYPSPGPGEHPVRIISWNVTLRCPLRCPHCYSNAGENDVPGTLSGAGICRIMDHIRDTGTPVVIMSGGEPLMREDIFEIARYGTDAGLRMAMGTSGYTFTPETAPLLRKAGIRKVAVSLDSADAGIHDAFRGRKHSFDRAVRAIRWCRREGLDVQINMTTRGGDGSGVDGVVSLGQSLGVQDFQIFFPVPTGRAGTSGTSTPVSGEEAIARILSRYHGSGVRIRPTCAPQFRRIADQLGIRNPSWGRGCIAGISYCRIYATGEVTPCPYIPVSAGNAQATSFGEIWNRSEVFAALRDPSRLTGKCHGCGFSGVCGGCRARAYGLEAGADGSCGIPVRSSDPVRELCGPDPWCSYHPGAVPS